MKFVTRPYLTHLWCQHCGVMSSATYILHSNTKITQQHDYYSYRLEVPENTMNVVDEFIIIMPL